MSYVQTEFMVYVNITINGKVLPRRTFTSWDNYDSCYQKIETYIKKSKERPEDEAITHILSATTHSHKVYYDPS